jgi:hypothetical protein
VRARAHTFEEKWRHVLSWAECCHEPPPAAERNFNPQPEGEEQMTMTNVVNLNERFERIERAYVVALAGRKPKDVSVFDLLPTIFEAIPDTTTEEIAAALRWSARKSHREADRLRDITRQRQG